MTTLDLNELIYVIIWLSIYAAVLVTFIFLVIYTIALLKRHKYENKHEYNLTFLQIRVPRENETEVKAAEHLFSSLWGFKKSFWQTLTTSQYRISFEIVSKSDGIGFYVIVPDEIVSLVEKQINGAYPEAEIDIVDPQEVWDRGEFTSIAELKLAAPSYYPIKGYEEMKGDSIGTLTSAISKMRDNEVVAIQYVISPTSDNWRNAGQTFISGVQNRANNPDKKVNIDTSFLEGIQKKIAHPGFDVAIRVVSIAENKLEADTHIRNVVSSFEQFTDVKYNRFKKRHFKPTLKMIEDFIYRRINTIDIQIPIFEIPIYRNTSVLNIVELATVFHFPNKEIKTPNILWLSAKRALAPSNVPDSGLYLGKSSFRGVERKIYMLDKDRTRHLYIIGQTGTGKSEFMKSMFLQDVKNGEGAAFIDPHGTAIDDILEKIPKERMDDVIIFDPSDTERPMGLNLLEAETEEEKHQLINAFISLLYKLYDPNHQGIMGPQLERSIRNVMLTAMEDPQATMVDVLRLLIDDKYVQKFLPLIKDPLVKKFWTDEQAKTTANRKGEMMGYIVSKFDRIVTERTMRNMVGQPKSSFNFHKIMVEKKILLVKLAKGKIGEENSNFIGLLIVPRILSAALARTKYIEQGLDFPNFFLYVDEFQNYSTPDIATILSEARKYKLNLVVAHQFIGQLDEKIKEAIFGNVGTMSVFRVGIDDAEYLEQQFAPTFSKNDLANNPNGSAYMKLLVNGLPTPPFSMQVDWDMITNTPKDKEFAKQLILLSRQKYGSDRKSVEDFVNDRSGANDPVPPPPVARDKIPF